MLHLFSQALHIQLLLDLVVLAALEGQIVQLYH
jgi:hypothetical protein